VKLHRISLIAAIALGGLVALCNTATAQDKGGGKRGMSVEERMTRLTEELKLTDEQKPKVKAVIEDENKQMQELRGDTSLSREDRRSKITSMREATNKKLKEILKPDQWDKYEKMQAEMKQKAAEKKGADKQ
jgi:Spy/CpxP family protein refolding chaperone